MHTFQSVHFVGLCCIIYIGDSFFYSFLNILMIPVPLEPLLYVGQCTHTRTHTKKIGFMLIPILGTLLDHI